MIPETAFGVPRRYVVCGIVCLLWLWAINANEGQTLDIAGRTWFVNWGVQALVSAASWRWSFPQALLARVDAWRQPRTRRSRLIGLASYARIIRWLHPFAFERQSWHRLETAMVASESTHLLSAFIVSIAIIVLLLRGSVTTALFLAFWNALFNLYPVALQRDNLARLRAIAARRSLPRLQPIKAAD